MRAGFFRIYGSSASVPETWAFWISVNPDFSISEISSPETLPQELESANPKFSRTVFRKNSQAGLSRRVSKQNSSSFDEAGVQTERRTSRNAASRASVQDDARTCSSDISGWTPDFRLGSFATLSVSGTFGNAANSVANDRTVKTSPATGILRVFSSVPFSIMRGYWTGRISPVYGRNIFVFLSSTSFSETYFANGKGSSVLIAWSILSKYASRSSHGTTSHQSLSLKSTLLKNSLAVLPFPSENGWIFMKTRWNTTAFSKFPTSCRFRNESSAFIPYGTFAGDGGMVGRTPSATIFGVLCPMYL